MAEAYTVLARRYRSQTFDELVGQEAIAQTLKNAVRTGRVAHAFLFTGTRGVGKTSAARILAKAINCPNRTADGNPCGECNSCKAVARGDDIDVIEIDGASNNSVDQIRELRQSAGIRPARSPFKIYIIDEVHMLTGGAFNALLKTLEEPPEHVKFIFATTDIHKVPATIISRCQRFDFKNIATARIAAHLKEIVKDEGIKADEEVLYRVARLGNGSMRDALSILDRVLSLGEKNITEKVLEDLLGKPPTAAIAEVVQAIANGDAAAAITKADALLREAMGVEQLLSELIEFLRNVMLVATCGEKTEILDVPAESRGMYTGVAAKFDPPTLVHLMALCEQTQRSLKASVMHRPLMDALIVRLALSEQFSSLKNLLAQAPGDDVKKKGDGGVGDKETGGPGESETGEENAEAVGHQDMGIASLPETPRPDFQGDAGSAAAEEAFGGGGDGEESIFDVMKQTMARQKQEQEAKNAQARQQQRTPQGYGRSQAAPVPPPAPTIRRVTDLTDLPSIWTAARAYLTVHAMRLETVLGGCSWVRSLTLDPPGLLLSVPSRLSTWTNDIAQSKLEEALRAVTGLSLKLRVEFVEPPEGTIGIVPGSPSGGGGGAAAQRVPPELLESVNKQPVVMELMKRLDAVITSVEMLGGDE